MRKKKAKVDCHIIPIYDVPLILTFYTNDTSDVLPVVKKFTSQKSIRRKWLVRSIENPDFKEDFSNAYGCTFTLRSTRGSTGILIQLSKEVFDDNDLIPVLSHEISHAVDRICEYCAVPLCIETTEPRAFLNGYLTEYCYKVLKKL